MEKTARPGFEPGNPCGNQLSRLAQYRVVPSRHGHDFLYSLYIFSKTVCQGPLRGRKLGVASARRHSCAPVQHWGRATPSRRRRPGCQLRNEENKVHSGTPPLPVKIVLPGRQQHRYPSLDRVLLGAFPAPEPLHASRIAQLPPAQRAGQDVEQLPGDGALRLSCLLFHCHASEMTERFI